MIEMSNGIIILIGIIIFEFSLVLLILLSIFVVKSYNKVLIWCQHKMIRDLTHYLMSSTLHQNGLNSKSLLKKWNNLQQILIVVHKLDETLTSHWSKIRESLIQDVILPLARIDSTKKLWTTRFYAVEAFKLGYEKTDEDVIVNLVNDDIPIISLHATIVAIRFGSKATINAIINRVSRKRWITKSTYLQAFDNAPETISNIIVRRLKYTKHFKIKTACYTVLVKFKPVAITWPIKNDIHAVDIDLRLAAIKFLAHSKTDEAIPILTGLLKDKSWEVRLVSLHRLGKLKSRESIKDIAECIYDSEEWIKISAIEILRSFGEEGERMLEVYAHGIKPIPFTLSKHITNTWW